MSVYQSVNDREQSTYHSSTNMEGSNVENAVKRDTVKPVAERLKRSESTIRRYTKALEEEGRNFVRQGKTRMYSAEDEALLSRMIQFTEELELSVEMAAKTVLNEDEALTEKLKEAKEAKESNEVAVRDFAVKLDEMFSILKDNFASKEDVKQLASMFEMIIQQDQQKSEMIQLQTEIIQAQNEKVEKLTSLVETSNQQTVQRDEVIQQLEASRKQSEQEKRELVAQTEEIIKKQNDMLFRIQTEREEDRKQLEDYKTALKAKDEETLSLQRQLKQSFDMYEETKGRLDKTQEMVDWQDGKLEEIKERLLDTNDKLYEITNKKGFIKSLFSRNK